MARTGSLFRGRDENGVRRDITRVNEGVGG